MSLMVYKKRNVEVLETAGSLSKIDDNGNIYSVKTVALKPLPVARVSMFDTLEKEVATTGSIRPVPPPYPDLINVKSVRVHYPARLEERALAIFQSLDIEVPLEKRGTIKGARGGKSEQRSMAATITFDDGRDPIHDLRLVLTLLSQEKAKGWRITADA